MRKIFFIKESLAHQITYYHLLVFAMALPFDRLYSELALISLCIHTLIHVTKKDIETVQFKKILMPVSVYLLTIIGTAYTHYYDEAFYEWERQLAILLFPLIVMYNSFDFKKYLSGILMGLAISCTLTVFYLYYIVYIIIRYNHLPITSVFNKAFLNHNFSAPIDMHATYFSMYIAVAAVALLNHILKTNSNKTKLIAGAMLLVLLLGLLQLSSRAVFIAMGVIVNLAIPFLVFQKKKRFFCMLASVLISITVFALVNRIENLKTRFTIELKEDLSSAIVNTNVLEPRAVRWDCAWQLIKQSPVFGHGSGSEVALLKDVYFQRKLYHSYLSELNAHNEYLSIFLKTGVIGLLFFLVLLLSGFKTAIHNRDVIFCGFMVIIAVISFSENILDANKGIFFFAFFFSLFYLGKGRELVTQR